MLEEEIMLFGKKAALAAAAFTGLMFASAANAADARLSDCTHMAKQVAEAINTAQPGQATEEALQQAKAGRGYCALSMYTQGVAYYSKALQLLGQPSKS
jgi:hypothetical protein